MPYLSCTVCGEDLPYPNAGHCYAHNQGSYIACANCNTGLRRKPCWVVEVNGEDYYLCLDCYKKCATYVQMV